MYYCPICNKQHTESHVKVCTCGFEDYNYKDSDDELLFKIFKYTKNVFLDRIPYTLPSTFIDYEDDGIYYIDIDSKPRGLEIIDGSLYDKDTCAQRGICALSYHARALILNTKYASRELLDESRVKILFIGKDFIDFIGEPILRQVKYLYVHKDNQYYESVNNKLMKKRML